MKKVFIAILALMCSLSVTNAQKRFEGLVSGGLNMSSLIGIDNTSPKTGLYAGFGSAIYITKRFGLSVEVVYSEQGTHCNPNEMGVDFDYNYNYMNVPVTLCYRLPRWGLTLFAGGQYGKLLDATYSYTAPSILEEGKYVAGYGEFDKSEFHPWDIGAILGFRWIFLPKYHLGVSARYVMGITQTHNGISDIANGHHYISVPDNRNSTIQLGLVMSF